MMLFASSLNGEIIGAYWKGKFEAYLHQYSLKDRATFT